MCGTHGSVRLQAAFGQLSSGHTRLAPVICSKHVTYSHLLIGPVVACSLRCRQKLEHVSNCDGTV